MIFDPKERIKDRIKDRIMACKNRREIMEQRFGYMHRQRSIKYPAAICLLLFHIIRCAVDCGIYCCVFIHGVDRGIVIRGVDLIINFVDLA